MGIENTTEHMKDPIYRALVTDGTENYGGHPGMIEQQERDGQCQLVTSELLPAAHGDDAPWLALGFTFGDPAPGDPLFVSATLPEGWEKRAADHSMGSVIADALGRNRVSIFYKAAWYDRSAHMTLVGLHWYVTKHVEYDEPLVISDEWATREAVLAAMRKNRDENLREADEFRQFAADVAGRRAENREGCAKIAGDRESTAAKYEAEIAALEAESA
jgi:hypothetical protein